MHYFVRIGGMIAGLAIGSAVAAYGLSVVMDHYSVLAGVNAISVFVGLLAAGLVGAALTKDTWFFI